MKTKPATTLIIAEVRESFLMAMNALTAHKLRSALTLLGVLIGVFSIIVVMTAMRVLKRTAETGLSQLGSQTFAVQRWPEAQFGDSSDWQKYWRRPYVTLEQGRRVEEKATLAAGVGIEGDFWRGQISTRFAKTAPTTELYGETPGSFPARNWDVEEGRILSGDDVDNAREVCVLGSALAKTAFPFGSAMGEEIKINGYKYAVVGVLAPKGGSLEGNQDNFAIIPITTALNRYGRWWDDLTILVQARDAASFDDCMEQVRGILRAARKVPPGKPDDFELFSNNSLIEQFDSFTRAIVAMLCLPRWSRRRGGVALPKISETLWYVATWREEWVALLSFSACALKCSARDRWIGWATGSGPMLQSRAR